MSNDLKKPIISKENSDGISNSNGGQSCVKKYLGLFYAVVAAFSLAAGNVFLRKAQYFNGGQKAVVKYLVQLVSHLVVMVPLGRSLLGPEDSRADLVLQGFFSFILNVSTFYALSFINPTDLIPLRRINIILVAIASRFLFKEKLNLTHILAIILTITGNFFCFFPKCQQSTIQMKILAMLTKNFKLYNQYFHFEVVCLAKENSYLPKFMHTRIQHCKNFQLRCEITIFGI